MKRDKLTTEQIYHLSDLGLVANDFDIEVFNIIEPDYSEEYLLSKLPKNINYYDTIYKLNIEHDKSNNWHISYSGNGVETLIEFNGDESLLNACYETICILLKNGYYKFAI